MTTQKVFKQRVRTRMTKTGESYTAARRQLLRKAEGSEPAASPATVPAAPPPIPPEAFLVADEAMVRGTGKGHAEWFAILDAWGGTEHTHTQIARWLRESQGTPSWWTQTITTSYERARGLRKPGQMATGFTVSVTRTIAADPAAALRAFTDVAIRETWLPGAPMRARPTRAANSARFDWGEPASRVLVVVAPRDGTRTQVSVAHERLPDPAAAERLKTAWRAALGQLKTRLEGA